MHCSCCAHRPRSSAIDTGLTVKRPASLRAHASELFVKCELQYQALITLSRALVCTELTEPYYCSLSQTLYCSATLAADGALSFRESLRRPNHCKWLGEFFPMAHQQWFLRPLQSLQCTSHSLRMVPITSTSPIYSPSRQPTT